MKLVSIIIPVYNGEKHIQKCLDKVLKQTYPNIEIIVLNDGSTDATQEILKEYKKKSGNIKIINKKNTGVSDTRNIGIKKAKGDFIIFLDSDDFLEDDAIDKMIKKTSDKDIDMLLFGFKVLGSKNRLNDTETLKKISSSQNVKEDLLKSIISTKNNIFGYIWRAMYSKRMLLTNDILFPNGIKISEDYMFLLNSIYHSNTILIDANEYYLYNINDQSMSIKYIPTLLNDMLFVNQWMYSKIVKNNVELIDGYYCCMCNTYLRFVQNTIRNKKLPLNEKIKLIKRIKHEKNFSQYINKEWYKYKKFPLKTFLSLIVFKFNLDVLYILLFNFKEWKV